MLDTVHGLLLDALGRFSRRTFLRQLTPTVDARIDYADAGRIIAGVVEQLRGASVQPGETAMCFAEDMVGGIFLFLGCSAAGVVPVPLPPSTSTEMLLALSRKVQARVLLTSDNEGEAGRRAGLSVLTYGPSNSLAGLTLGRNFTAGDALHVLSSAGRHDGSGLYVLQPTSGTTSLPKLVKRTHKAFVRATRVLSRGFDREVEPAERLLMVAALTHGMGQYMLALGVALGAEFSVPEHIDTAASLTEVRRLDPTILCLTPRVLRSFAAQQQKLGEDPRQRLFGPSAKLLSVGGAACDAALMRKVQADGVDVAVAYGASECSLVSFTDAGKWREGSAGRILDDVEVRLDPEDGELLVKTPGMFTGYLGDEALTREAFTPDGYYRTGDFGALHDGELEIRGRKRDVFNTFDGSNIYPVRIEEQLEALPSVAQAVLFGDQRPFLAAVLVLKEAHGGAEPNGLLDERKAADAYARVRAEVAALNERLEPNERIQKFVLRDAPLPGDLYALVGHGKVRRTRAALAAAFATTLAEFYR